MWDMEIEGMEALLEKIWDLHDKLSDQIHSICRSHFLNSIKSKPDRPPPPPPPPHPPLSSTGFVFTKDFRSSSSALAEARSLNAIRTALENLEDQLDFFHTVQSQQRAERDAAIARLEQSRIVLAMRLADHHGKRYKVIEEALAFVGDVPNASQFVTRNAFETPKSQSVGNADDGERKKSNTLLRMLISTFTFARKSLKVESVGALLGNAALIAVSMLAMLQLHQVASKRNFVLQLEDNPCCMNGNDEDDYQFEGYSSSSPVKHLDVLLARG